MRINLEGVKQRREHQIDRIKFGESYSSSYDRHASFPIGKVAAQKPSKRVWQTGIAVLMVVSAVFVKQASAPWAETSMAFIHDVVERDYNWQGVVTALSDNNLFNRGEEWNSPVMSGSDPEIYNEFASKFPVSPDTAPVFSQSPPQSEDPTGDKAEMAGTGQTNMQSTPSLILPLEGLLVKKFTEDKPYIEYIALENKQVVAAADGVVKQVGYNDKEELLVHIDSGAFIHVYGRLSDVQVKEGDAVKQGQALATIGTADEVTLLLFQIIKENKAVDPEAMLP